LAGEIISPELRTLVGDPLVAPIPADGAQVRRLAPERDVASGHGDTPGDCQSPGKPLRHTLRR